MSTKVILQPWQPMSHYDSQRYRCVGEVEEAWAKDKRITNYRLKDGDTVTLKHSTIGDGPQNDALVPSGVSGVVTRSRIPRVKRRGGKGSLYFASVKVVSPAGTTYVVRVPHSSIKICKDHGS